MNTEQEKSSASEKTEMIETSEIDEIGETGDIASAKTAKSVNRRKIMQRRIICFLSAAVVVFGLVFVAACAPRQAEAHVVTDISADAESAVPYDFTMQSDCTVCHAAQVDTLAAKTCPQEDRTDASVCVTCHSDESVMKTAHANITLTSVPDAKISNESVDSETCMQCHGTLEDMALITVDSQVLKDSNGKVVNPHARPDGDTHAQNPVICTDCHNSHSADLAKDAMKYCAQCHHRGIFSCGNCHPVRTRI